ncbi:hypothetical protein CYG49_04315 [Candidatus Saccharibacteria bacterium]|nr:MAG: hypothetical protein CYG49_04315 [Candidatus Saccharibacteria bacterium]
MSPLMNRPNLRLIISPEFLDEEERRPSERRQQPGKMKRSKQQLAVPTYSEVRTAATRIISCLRKRGGHMHAPSLKDAATRLQGQINNLRSFGSDKRRYCSIVMAALELMLQDGRIDYDDRDGRLSVMKRSGKDAQRRNQRHLRVVA